LSTRLFSITGYIHLYRSLLRFGNMSVNDAKELVYWLNTANIDSYSKAYPNIPIYQSSPFVFCRRLDEDERPYRTEVQLYKALEALKASIDFTAIISEQREAVQQMKCVMSNLEFNFFKVFDTEIDSALTIYGQCRNHLIPFEDEPSVCLFDDWLYLPTA